jgi:hypothetical protein
MEGRSPGETGVTASQRRVNRYFVQSFLSNNQKSERFDDRGSGARISCVRDRWAGGLLHRIAVSPLAPWIHYWRLGLLGLAVAIAIAALTGGLFLV